MARLANVDGAELDAAHGFLFVAKLHTGEELEVKGVVRILLGQFDEFVIEDVSVILRVRVHGGRHDHRGLRGGFRSTERKADHGCAQQAGNKYFSMSFPLELTSLWKTPAETYPQTAAETSSTPPAAPFPPESGGMTPPDALGKGYFFARASFLARTISITALLLFGIAVATTS